MKRDRISKKRRQLARAVERAAVPERPFFGPGPRYLVHPYVTTACTASLRAIAAALRDETLVLGEHELRAVETFILDGRSPFFGRDANAAMQQAVRLQHAVIGAKLAVSTERKLEAKDVRVPGPAMTTRTPSQALSKLGGSVRSPRTTLAPCSTSSRSSLPSRFLIEAGLVSEEEYAAAVKKK